MCFSKWKDDQTKEKKGDKALSGFSPEAETVGVRDYEKSCSLWTRSLNDHGDLLTSELLFFVPLDAELWHSLDELWEEKKWDQKNQPPLQYREYILPKNTPHISSTIFESNLMIIFRRWKAISGKSGHNEN